MTRSPRQKAARARFSALFLPGLLLIGAWRWLRPPEIPTINAYRGDFTLKWAHAEYLQNSNSLLAKGVAEFKGPSRIITALGFPVALPAAFTDWVRKCEDLNHPKHVAD